MGIAHNSYALNGTNATKLSLEVLLRGIVAESGDHQGLERITTDVGVLLGLEDLRNLLRQSLDRGLLLQLLPVACLQPTFGGNVVIGILVGCEVRKELGETSYGSSLAFFGRMVTRGHPSQGRSRRKKREEIGRELVGHL